MFVGFVVYPPPLRYCLSIRTTAGVYFHDYTLVFSVSVTPGVVTMATEDLK